MLAIVTFIFGAIFGWVRAKRRGGSTADRVQYAIAHAVAFGLAGLILGTVLALTGLFPGA